MSTLRKSAYRAVDSRQRAVICMSKAAVLAADESHPRKLASHDLGGTIVRIVDDYGFDVAVADVIEDARRLAGASGRRCVRRG